MATTTIESLGEKVDTRSARPKLLYPALIIAAISVTGFSLIGIAAITGVMPAAYSSSSPGAKISTTADKPARSQGSAEKSPASAIASCVACGTVESVTTVERQANTSGVGAVAGGLTGALLGNQIGRGNGRTVMTLAGGAGGAYLGNKIEQNSRRSAAYKVVVRMENGGLRTIYQTEAPNVLVGGPVQIVGNSVVPRS